MQELVIKPKDVARLGLKRLAFEAKPLAWGAGDLHRVLLVIAGVQAGVRVRLDRKSVV